jgi:hypothetical protein
MQNQNGDPGSERLTIEEIYNRFPDEWVLLDEIQVDQAQHVLSGRVIAHSADRDRVYDAMLKSDSSELAVRFTGRIPDDVAVIL